MLGLCVFCIGTTEVMVAGLLPMLSRDFGISIPQAGMLISAYAAGVVVGGPALTLAFLKMPRKQALLILLGLFLAGQTLGAIAGNYPLLLASRVFAALAQGALFGIGSLLAVDLAGPQAKGRALAVMFGGLTIANILGAPFGTVIGDAWGWRASFWAVSLLALLSLALIALLVPRQARPPYAGLRREFAAFTSPRLWRALGITALSQAGLFAAYSYFSPLLTDVSGFDSGAVPLLQAWFGLGCFMGTYLGGKFTDRHPQGILRMGLLALVVTMGLFALMAQHQLATLAVLLAFGVAAFSINPALQAQVIDASPDAPTLATTANTSAFNVGNAVGPWLGGMAITAGMGYTATVWLGAALALGALLVAWGVAKD